jgi:hypothetical protein
MSLGPLPYDTGNIISFNIVELTNLVANFWTAHHYNLVLQIPQVQTLDKLKDTIDINILSLAIGKIVLIVLKDNSYDRLLSNISYCHPKWCFKSWADFFFYSG